MSPRLLLFAALALLTGLTASAQLNLGKLGKALEDASAGQAGADKLTKGLTTLKDAGKLAKGVAGIGPEEESVIGESVALEIIARYGGLVRDEAVTARVNLIGRALATYSARPQLSWRFGVLNSDTINAFSAPDGYVFISRALYDLCPTDDLLAAVLGHEIAHITGRHALAIVARGEFLSGLSSQLAMRSSDFRQTESQLKQFDLGVEKVVSTLFEKGFDPKTEFAADKEGRDLAALCGYAPGGLRAVLVMLSARGGDPKKLFSSHPPLKDRIARLPAEAAQPGPAAPTAPTGAPHAPAATPGAKPAGKVSDDDQAFFDEAEKPKKKKP